MHSEKCMYVHTLSRSGIKNFPDQRVFFPQLKGEGGTVYPEWLDKKDWKKNIAKMQAVTAEGYYIELWILDKKGNILEKLTQACNFKSKYIYIEKE